MRTKMIILAMCGFVVLLPFSTCPFTIRDGVNTLEFDKLSEPNKKRIKEIVKYFGNDVDIQQFANRPYNMIIQSVDTLFVNRIKNDVEQIKLIDTHESHLNGKNGAIKKIENLAKKICNDAGYPSNTLYSLKLDTITLSRDVKLERDKQNEIKRIQIRLQEYYNDIPVARRGVIVAVYGGALEVANFNAAGIANATAEAMKPLYSFDEALKKCLENLNIEARYKPAGEMSYYFNPKYNKLSLCWHLWINTTKGELLSVWVNSVTGNLEYNENAFERANISGH